MMRSPQVRNGVVETPSPSHFHSSVSVHKLRRFNILIVVFRFASFCFSLASAIFMFTNSRRGSDLPQWHHFDAFRFVAVAGAIVALYSLFEVGASVWEISRGATVFPEVVQVWFDFGHDQLSFLPVGICVPIAVGGIGGNVLGSNFEGDGHVYG
ncbi:hypothetical protein KY290_020679 [Solanum tuberosum]|uniref:CASP-like protein n=1 Tax=Solanum tuberosum TaxID=4113 RepID=A0ABQ7UZH7_SOLTU|nr:hypothetical protein KY290_020679 [Solanum tuberosum]